MLQQHALCTFMGFFPPKGTTAAKGKRKKEVSVVPTSLSRSNSLRTGRSSGFCFFQSTPSSFTSCSLQYGGVWAHTAMPPTCTLCSPHWNSRMSQNLSSCTRRFLCRKRLCFIVSLCFLSYRWVHFPRSVLFCLKIVSCTYRCQGFTFNAAIQGVPIALAQGQPMYWISVWYSECVMILQVCYVNRPGSTLIQTITVWKCHNTCMHVTSIAQGAQSHRL